MKYRTHFSFSNNITLALIMVGAFLLTIVGISTETVRAQTSVANNQLAAIEPVGEHIDVTAKLRVKQTGTVSGTVTVAASGDPLPGVNVMVQGTTMGAVTNTNGHYTIEDVPVGKQTIVAQFIGFKKAKQQIVVHEGETTTLNFSLQKANLKLNQLVVTATGRKRVRSIGNKIVTIDAAKITKVAPVGSFSQLLKGRAQV